MSSTTITRRRAPLTAQERQERQTELLNTLADGVAELATSDGWARFLRAMGTLRRYSTGNRQISHTRECTCDLDGGHVIPSRIRLI